MPDAEFSCLRPVADGTACELSLHVVPGASRTAVAGVHGGALRVRLAAPPIDGRANAELLRWLSRALGLPGQAVVLVAGERSRRKRVRIAAAVSLVLVWLRPQLEAPPSGR
jgi:uncharacterized protein (TIGR00251 family)